MPAGRHDFRFKCQECSLHFQLHSWQEDWLEKFEAYCPECGSQGAKMIWHEEMHGFVFEAVPGLADLVGMGMSGKFRRTN